MICSSSLVENEQGRGPKIKCYYPNKLDNTIYIKMGTHDKNTPNEIIDGNKNSANKGKSYSTHEIPFILF